MCLHAAVQMKNIIRTAFVRMISFATACYIRTNIDHHEIDHRMHSYELVRVSVIAP